MSDNPVPSTDNNPDLFDLAAELAGCAPVDLLKVRQEGASLVVILITGQKLVFDGADIAGRIAGVIRAQLAPAPAAAGATISPSKIAPKPKTPAPRRGAGEA